MVLNVLDKVALSSEFRLGHIFLTLVSIDSHFFVNLVLWPLFEDRLGSEVDDAVFISLACRMYFGKAFLITEALNDVDLVEAAG